MSKLFLFLKKKAPKRTKFSIFKGKFIRNAWPYGNDFWLVFRDLCEASNKHSCARYSTSYNNINAKKWLKLDGP